MVELMDKVNEIPDGKRFAVVIYGLDKDTDFLKNLSKILKDDNWLIVVGGEMNEGYDTMQKN